MRRSGEYRSAVSVCGALQLITMRRMNKVTMREDRIGGLQLLAMTHLLLAALGDGGPIRLAKAEDGKRTPLVPALWVFGDSVLDAGTNSFFNSLRQADFKPYGQQFGKATGRFTNGRVYADFVADFVGLPLVRPYFKTKNTSNTLLLGLNYASAGSGLLRATNAADVVIPFPDQLLQFQQTRLHVAQKLRSASAAEDLFSKSLFLVTIGGNDVYGYGRNMSIAQDVFFDGLVTVLNDSIKELYDAGARKLLVVGSVPLGCLPASLATAGVTNGKCVEPYNVLTQNFNARLEELVLGLNSSFPNLRAIVGKPFNQFQDFLSNPEKYGFSSLTTACCGSGIYNGEMQCGRPANLITHAPYNLCENADEYVFWDYLHPTQKAYGIIADQFITGNSSSVAPVNLMTLVSS